MCGLIGAAGDLSSPHVDAVKQLLVVNQFRGSDSTGVASVGYNSDDIKFLKKIGGPHELFDSQRFSSVVNVTRRCIIGHGRYKTLGAVSVENAHPFVFKNVIGAHNGTLDSAYHKDLEDANLFGTDSETLYANMDKNGVVDTIGKLQLTEEHALNGAWALTFYRPENNTINFVRNAKRPLAYTFTEDRKVMFWASEAGMLHFVLGRCGIKYLKNDKGFGQAWGVPEDTWLSWEIPKGVGAFGEPTRVSDVKGKPVEVKKSADTSAFFRQGYGWRGASEEDFWEAYAATRDPRSTSTSTGGSIETNRDHTSNVVGFHARREASVQTKVETNGRVCQRSRSGVLMSEEDFNRATQGINCGWCDGAAVYGKAHFQKEHQVFLCTDCISDSGCKADFNIT